VAVHGYDTKYAMHALRPDQPDRRWVDDWLHRGYQAFWNRALLR
jgi:hypothetical protein